MQLHTLRRFRNEEEGQALVEYGILISLLAIAIIGTLSVAGAKLNNAFLATNQPVAIRQASIKTEINVAPVLAAQVLTNSTGEVTSAWKVGLQSDSDASARR